MEILFYFFVYSFIGWLAEDIYCGIGQRKIVNRGFLYGPYCPIYGFGSLIVIYLLIPIQEHPLLVFLGGFFFTSLLEYITSYIMEKLFNERWWDYSTYPFNINGRVCLRNSLLFGIMAFVLIYLVHPHVANLYLRISPKILNPILIIVLVLFIFDIFATVKHLLSRKAVAKKIHEAINQAKTQFEEEEKQLYHEHREAFIKWAKQNKELAEKFVMLKSFEESHLSKAFPDRIIIHKEINELIKEIKESYNNMH